MGRLAAGRMARSWGRRRSVFVGPAMIALWRIAVSRMAFRLYSSWKRRIEIDVLSSGPVYDVRRACTVLRLVACGMAK